MPNLPPSQLQSMLGHLDQALYNHEQWYKNV
ncbi:MAG: diguanylate cyclase, partial [Nevskia sp.]|nr:diguanylate cyclase [Nevskia sp.]